MAKMSRWLVKSARNVVVRFSGRLMTGRVALGGVAVGEEGVKCRGTSAIGSQSIRVRKWVTSEGKFLG